MSDESIVFSTKRTAPQGQSAYFDKVNSHAADLFNERLAILWYMLDMDMMLLNQNHAKDELVKVRSILLQLWKNIRTIVRNNPACRKRLHLDTKINGVYTVDVAFGMFNTMYLYCENDKKLGFTYQNIWIMTDHLNNIELILRDVLQYFQYFMRTEYKQLPDILQAAENYKAFADKLTVDQLKEVVGKRNKIDFEGLGQMITDDEDLLEPEGQDILDDDSELSEAEERLEGS